MKKILLAVIGGVLLSSCVQVRDCDYEDVYVNGFYSHTNEICYY